MRLLNSGARLLLLDPDNDLLKRKVKHKTFLLQMKQSLINIICILFVAVMAVGCGGKKKGASSEVPSSQQTGAATSASGDKC